MPKRTEEALERDQNRLVEIHTARLASTQELGWLFRPLAVCPFPAASLGKREVIDRNGKKHEEHYVLWTRRAGNIKVEILGHPDYGIPHGQDTLVILYLAYEARRQGSRKIKVNFYRDFMRMFEMNPNDGRKYRLVVQSLQRIRNAKYSWEVEGETGREKGLHFLYIDEYDLYCDPKHPDQRPLFDQYILLSERFWHEIDSHRIPSNLKAVVALKSQPARLNFYVWLSYRTGQAYAETIGKGQGPARIVIPFWGPAGLQAQMSSLIQERYNFRIHVKRWLKAVLQVWPECPAWIDGDALIVHVERLSQLDVMPKETDAPRILPKPESPKKETSTCPKCGQVRTLEPGKKSSERGYLMPDYWSCSGGCKPVSVDAICKHCRKPMERQKSRNPKDYLYFCSQCQHYEPGEHYWLMHSVAVKQE
jgi:hypothetical protein